MQMYHIVFFLLAVVFILTPPSACLTGGNGECFNELNITRCCSGFKEINNECIECIGKFGYNCSFDCPDNYYGPQCRYICYCAVDKYCDSVRGCVCNETSPNCTVDPVQSTNKPFEQSNACAVYYEATVINGIMLTTAIVLFVMIGVFYIYVSRYKHVTCKIKCMEIHWSKGTGERKSAQIQPKDKAYQDELIFETTYKSLNDPIGPSTNSHYQEMRDDVTDVTDENDDYIMPIDGHATCLPSEVHTQDDYDDYLTPYESDHIHVVIKTTTEKAENI